MLESSMDKKLGCYEPLLTGESLPVTNIYDTLNDPVGDHVSMIHTGSQVTEGRARAVVMMTGMKTELGKIAVAMERREINSASSFAKFRHNAPSPWESQALLYKSD